MYCIIKPSVKIGHGVDCDEKAGELKPLLYSFLTLESIVYLLSPSSTVRTLSISGSDASRTARLVNQARLERLHEEKHRVDKKHKHILERLVELDTRRRFLESEIDQTQTELVEEEDAASNRSLSTSVKSSHK